MSYILDALRKADAERERGSVPGIHAQPVFAGAAPARAQRAGWPAWGWVAAAVVAVLALVVAGLLWALLGASSAPSPALSRAVTEPIATSRATALPAAPVPPIAAIAPLVEPKVEAVKPVSAPAPAPAPAVRKPKAPAAAASAASGVAEARIYALNELPDEIRRQLPPVSVGGSAYSAKAADRILIINGQVLHEGDRIAPELVLQQIKLKAAVLAFKGYRYNIAF